MPFLNLYTSYYKVCVDRWAQCFKIWGYCVFNCFNVAIFILIYKTFYIPSDGLVIYASLTTSRYSNSFGS